MKVYVFEDITYFLVENGCKDSKEHKKELMKLIQIDSNIHGRVVERVIEKMGVEENSKIDIWDCSELNWWRKSQLKPPPLKSAMYLAGAKN